MRERPVQKRKKHARSTLRVARMGVLTLAMFALLVSGFLYLTRETRAVAGDFAIYRESTGTESLTITLTDQAWDTTVSQSSIFSIDAGRTTVTLSEAGHYLALYNTGVEVVTGTQKGEIQGFLNVNGTTQLGYGRSSCYIENQGGQSKCWFSGASIVETTATNQTVKVQIQRSDDGTLSLRRIAGTSGFTLLRLDDDWQYARMREVGGGQSFNVATWATILLDTNDELDTNYARTGGDITLTDAGKYLVSTNAHFVSTRSSRNRLIATRLTLNGTEVNGTRVTALMTGTNSAFDAVASYVGVIETTSANQVLRLQGACVGAQCGQTTNAPNGTAVTIVKLPDTVEMIGVTEVGGGQQVDTTNDPILWDTNVFNEGTAFTHSTTSNTSRVVVNTDDDYLFLSSFYSNRVSATTVILNPHWEWRENGSTKLTYGSFGAVNRGVQSTYGALRSGASGGAIFTGLTANDYIEVVNTDESTGVDSDPVFEANAMALQGIRLSSLQTPDIVVSSFGSQFATTSIPSTNFYVGGGFLFSASHSFPTETITSITITETGTVDAAANISNVKLFYDLDTSTPYDCASESYSGTELQYGATAVGGFSGANGSATFSGSVVASTTQAVCMYVVLDVDSGASVNETIAIEISSPETDVVLGGGPVGPTSAVALSGVTTLEDDLLTQIHYHWRNDDGTEASATSATGGNEDTVLVDVPKLTPYRLRLEVSNEGTAVSPPTQYRMEYATRTTSCEVTTGWVDVGISGNAWELYDSPNLTNGDNTTNIAIATGGVTDENTTFLTPNGGVRDTTSQTGSLTLTGTQFVELEYSLRPTILAVDGESYCFRVTDAGTPLPSYSVYPEASISADVLVQGFGTHTANVDASTTDFYIGGGWAVIDKVGSRDVTSITVHEIGTVDASTNIENVRLYYEMDTSIPYDCASESFDGTEDQYGATVASFSSADGLATFSETVGISTTETMCLYAVVDVAPSASNNETLQIEMSDPGSYVVVSTGTVNPNSPVGPTGSTTIQKAILEQVHYHFRNDDGTEAGATSATDGIEDTSVTNIKKTETLRMRMEVTNTGGTSTVPTEFTLEYAERSGSCSATGGWQEVGTPGGAWAMSDSLFLTHGDSTTNIAPATGGVTDENTTFLTPNGGVLDTSPTSEALRLTTANFLELEYAIEATTFASFGATYCFRLSGSGSAIETYTVFPQATIAQNQDFYIQRGRVDIPNGNSQVTISAGTNYVSPSSATKAFVRITNSMHTGAGQTAGGDAQNSDRVMAHVSNPANITSSINFTRTGTVGTTRIYWEIIEYTGPSGGDNEMIVRSAQVHSSGSKSLTENISVSGVADGSDVVVFLTGQSTIEASTLEYQTGIVTTNWNSATNQVVLERGAFGSGAGNPVTVSFAVVEFTGPNWSIQRVEHTYGAVGTDQNQTITDVNDMSRAFIHAQHRTTLNTVADFAHTVWLLNVSTVSFRLSGGASTPANHTSVAWVIENTQTNGTPMVVTRSNGTQSAGGIEPATYSIAIGKTLSGLSVSSIFMTMYSDGANTLHPNAIMGATIASTTHYELWISDTGSSRGYRTEIVEWPTAVLAVSQNYYRWYVNNDALLPTDPWPPGATNIGENTSIMGLDEPPVDGGVIRLRMSLSISGSNISQGSAQYRLEYGVRDTSCSAISSWLETGDSASTTALWRGYNATPLDGVPLSSNPPTIGDLVLSVSDRAGTYEEANPTAPNPYKMLIGDDVEYDWILQANGITDFTTYCFRMVENDRAEIDEYVYYPTITSAGFEVQQQDWRWFGDEASLTPLSALAATNTAPVNIPNGDAIKLRVMLEEIAGRNGDNVKYKLQWSEYSDFSVAYDVKDRDTCESGSRWCYFDGAGTEGATITERVLATADTCASGVGDGCGTHNEYSYAPSIVGEVGTTSTDSTGTTVTLKHTYTDPVFIVEAISGDATGSDINRPAIAIITATTTSSFTVRIQEPDNEADDHGAELVSYIVMERGSYLLPDGRKVDVNTRDTGAYFGNAVLGASDDTCTFTQTFTSAPVVLASLQTNNNTSAPDFLNASIASITSDDFTCALEVPDGESNAPSVPETVGWIAIEGGVFTNNSIQFEATSTTVSITGWTDTPWYEQAFTQEFLYAPGIVATKQTRNGSEGGWVRYDNEDSDSVQFAIDERDDGERSHASESVGYIAFSKDGLLYGAGLSGFTFAQGTKREFEFTITHYDARPNVTYFFRLYDTLRDEAVSTSTSSTFPSLSTEGATLTFSVSGVSQGVATEGVMTDVTTTATSVPFGSLSLGVLKNAAQRVTVTTNATEGYQVLMFERQGLIGGGGAIIEDITGSNASPVPWSVGCPLIAPSCYGYHTGDNTLAGGSTRFLLDDTFAPLTGTLSEVAYSSGPVTNEATDIVFRVRVGSGQPAGLYESKVGFVVVPVF